MSEEKGAIYRPARLNPDPIFLRGLKLKEMTNPFIVRLTIDVSGQPIPKTIEGWEWEETPEEFLAKQRDQATMVLLILKRSGDYGDVVGIFAERGGYAHKGTVLGDGTVIHFTGGRKNRSVVSRTPIKEFIKNSSIAPEYPPIGPRLNPGLTALLALRHVGLKGYSLLKSNCEHFMEFCLTGEWYSHQIESTRRFFFRALVERTKRFITRYGLNPNLEAEESIRVYQNWPGGHQKAHKKFLLDPDGSRVPFWLGDLWRDENQHIYIQVWTRIPWDEYDLDVTVPLAEGGYWSEGPPWKNGEWSSTTPNEKMYYLGELWFDNYLSAYLRGWL